MKTTAITSTSAKSLPEERAARVIDIGGGTAYLHTGPYEEYRNILRMKDLYDEYLMVRILNEARNCFAWDPYAQRRLSNKTIRITVTHINGSTEVIE